MKLWKRLLALGLSASLCLALAACQNGEADPSGSPDPSASPADPSASPSADIQVDLTQTMFEFASGLKDGDTALTVNGGTANIAIGETAVPVPGVVTLT